MAELDTDPPEPTRSYLAVGWLIVISGSIVLLLTLNYIKERFPFLEVIWPIILVVALIAVAPHLGNPLASLGAVFLALLGVIALLNDNGENLRLFIGAVILGAGIGFVAYLMFGRK